MTIFSISKFDTDVNAYSNHGCRMNVCVKGVDLRLKQFLFPEDKNSECL